MEVNEEDTIQLYFHTEFEEVDDISTFETIPLIEIVGVAAIASEKVAVIVTTEEFDTIPVDAVEDKVTVGDIESLANH